MQKWEFFMARITVFGHDDFDRHAPWLNDRGNEGWELVSVTTQRVAGTKPDEPGDEYTFFFKRPKG
jgi:hypothetical protein